MEILTSQRQVMLYDNILQADKAITKEVLETVDEWTCAVIPLNMAHGRKTEFGKDNLDTLIQSAIAGKNS